MTNWETNVYDYPEKSGLEIVGEAEYIGGYEWDKFVVWRDLETGDLYYGEASGCSCNSPSDYFETREDLFLATKHDILAALGKRKDEDAKYDYDQAAKLRESDQLIEKVAAL